AAAATRVPEARGADAERARELLAGNTPADPKPSATGTGRYILQVGAFADASAAHDTRLKAEKLGLKTYTQVASTPAGNRIRVRVGPYASRDEADKALAKARAAGLSAVVLTL
ncbi:MAG: SPOR domain-containing protein, partial [Pseudomonadota bacterium]|nr:SPOR domain-containing protein [Pseudomonadota bacterium]